MKAFDGNEYTDDYIDASDEAREVVEKLMVELSEKFSTHEAELILYHLIYERAAFLRVRLQKEKRAKERA